VKRSVAEIAALARLIDTALELPPEQRDTWIEQLSSDHDTLKPTLRKLLAMPPAGNDTFTLADVSQQVQAALQGAAGAAETLEFRTGARVGPYELIRELGRGGMGTVWLARRTEGLTRRVVALKLPHPGLLHAEFAARMQRERDILESLAHPNIARLYDAGVTPAGQPYLALEYVEGVPLNAFCDSKRLGLAERLALFAQVLQAIQHAHSHLVIHRDLKPANILVTDAGVAMVLDFGIAKLTVEGATLESPLTQLGGRALTPDYASPEQIAGTPLTTASDVYSLAVILYELATGERPYKLARGSAAALEEAILAADVRRPSQAVGDDAKAALRATTVRKLARALRGDLDTIVLTGLRVKLADRYRSVDALAQDIGHYLAGRAISARPQSWWEGTHRFVVRHKVAVGSAALVMLALTGGIATATWQAAKARASEQRAIAAAATSDAVKQFLIRIFQSNTLAQANAADARGKSALQLLEDGADRVGVEFKDKPALHRELLTIITRMLGESRSDKYKPHALELIALLKGVPGSELQQAEIFNELAIMENGRQPEQGRKFAEAGLGLLGNDPRPDYRKMRGTLSSSLATSLTQLGDNAAAEAPLLQARDLLANGFSNTAEYGHVLASLGWREVRNDHIDAAADYFERAMKAFEADPTAFQRTLAQGHNDLSVAYSLRKRWADAERELEAAAQLFRKDYGPEDPETALATARAANAVTQQNRYDEAIDTLRGAVVILEKPTHNAVADYVVAGWEYLANALVQSGRLQEAQPAARRAVELADPLGPYQQANPCFIMGELAALRGDAKLADMAGKRGLELLGKVFAPDTARFLKAKNRLGRILLGIGRIDEADALFVAIMQADAANAAKYDTPWTFASVSHARAQMARGDAAAAVPALRAALTKYLAQPEVVRDLNEELDLRLALGQALTATDHAGEALPHLERALTLRQPQFATSPLLAEAQIALANCKLRLGDTGAARALLARAKSIHVANRELGEQFRAPLRDVERRLAETARIATE
jgi:tetratricopeptide (TPR) repeat protein